jgi:hypothetical protein
MADAISDDQAVPLTIRNRLDEFKIEQGLHAGQLPFLDQVRAEGISTGKGPSNDESTEARCHHVDRTRRLALAN